MICRIKTTKLDKLSTFHTFFYGCETCILTLNKTVVKTCVIGYIYETLGFQLNLIESTDFSRLFLKDRNWFF